MNGKRCPACGEVFVRLRPGLSFIEAITRVEEAMDFHLQDCAPSHTPAVNAAVDQVVATLRDMRAGTPDA